MFKKLLILFLLTCFCFSSFACFDEPPKTCNCSSYGDDIFAGPFLFGLTSYLKAVIAAKQSLYYYSVPNKIQPLTINNNKYYYFSLNTTTLKNKLNETQIEQFIFESQLENLNKINQNVSEKTFIEPYITRPYSLKNNSDQTDFIITVTSNNAIDNKFSLLNLLSNDSTITENILELSPIQPDLNISLNTNTYKNKTVKQTFSEYYPGETVTWKCDIHGNCSHDFPKDYYSKSITLNFAEWTTENGTPLTLSFNDIFCSNQKLTQNTTANIKYNYTATFTNGKYVFNTSKFNEEKNFVIQNFAFHFKSITGFEKVESTLALPYIFDLYKVDIIGFNNKGNAQTLTLWEKTDKFTYNKETDKIILEDNNIKFTFESKLQKNSTISVKSAYDLETARLEYKINNAEEWNTLITVSDPQFLTSKNNGIKKLQETFIFGRSPFTKFEEQGITLKTGDKVTFRIIGVYKTENADEPSMEAPITISGTNQTEIIKIYQHVKGLK